MQKEQSKDDTLPDIPQQTHTARMGRDLKGLLHLNHLSYKMVLSLMHLGDLETK